MKQLPKFIWILLLGLMITPALANVVSLDCPDIVHQALNSTNQLCTGTGRNQACYGHILLEAQPQPGIATFAFENAGDKVDVTTIRSLHLSPLEINSGVWGVALMHLQADLPDAQVGDVTLLTFGDVDLQNAVQIPTHLNVTVTGADFVNVRQTPNTESPTLGVLTSGQVVTALERLPDNSWIRVELAGSGTTGWVYAPMVTSDGDVSTLNVTEWGKPYYRPMQAFYFQSSEQETACPEVPASGLLIQTPEGAGEIKLLINEVNVRLGSTVYFQAQPENEMTVTTLEGHATVEAMGIERTAVAGTQVRIPLDTNMRPAAPPSLPEAYDAATLKNLPISLLDRSITIHPGLTSEEIAQLYQNQETGIVGNNSGSTIATDTATGETGTGDTGGTVVTDPGTSNDEEKSNNGSGNKNGQSDGKGNNG